MIKWPEYQKSFFHYFFKNWESFLIDEKQCVVIEQKINLCQIDADVNETFDNDIKKFINDVLVTKQHYLKRYLITNHDCYCSCLDYSWTLRFFSDSFDWLSFLPRLSINIWIIFFWIRSPSCIWKHRVFGQSCQNPCVFCPDRRHSLFFDR